MEDQILGSKGTMEMAKGIYYLEEDHSTSGIRQLIDQVKDKVFAAIPTAGPSWRPETKMEYTPHFIIDGDIHVNSGLSMIGADKDGHYPVFFLPVVYHRRESTECSGRSILFNGSLFTWKSGNG